MTSLKCEARAFAARKAETSGSMRQVAAAQLLCGIDLLGLEERDESYRRLALQRVERAMIRERMKARNRHWSYDLNRHIALKQAADTLRASLGMDARNPARWQARQRRQPRAAPPS